MFNKSDIKPRNTEQAEASRALLDPNIDLVILTGNAGSGKTLLTMAAALDLSGPREPFNKILVARPLIPLGRDIGHLPGTKEEKLEPWMAPIYDNIKILLGDNYKFFNLEDLIEHEAVTFMRGRSLCKTFMIIDEAQNLDYLELKTILTRAGAKSKVVILGDPAQSDIHRDKRKKLPLLDIADRMGESPHVARIHLNIVERSRLAKAAVKRL